MNRYLPLITAILLLTGPAIGTPLVSAAVGDRVLLEGFAPGADEVYLLLTGPNLPANGVRLEDISAPIISGDPSTFTRTSVESDRWEYSWYTRTKGGTPDAGTYTIFIVTKPVGRKDLAGSEYATIMVSLGSPGLVILPAGGVTIRSSPQSAGMFLEGIPNVPKPMERNDTPLDNHTIEIRTQDYISATGTLVVNGENNTAVEGTLDQAVNLDTIPPGTTPPEKIPTSIIEVITAIGCVPGLKWFRRKIR